jgi:hypothetical protein
VVHHVHVASSVPNASVFQHGARGRRVSADYHVGFPTLWELKRWFPVIFGRVVLVVLRPVPAHVFGLGVHGLDTGAACHGACLALGRQVLDGRRERWLGNAVGSVVFCINLEFVNQFRLLIQRARVDDKKGQEGHLRIRFAQNSRVVGSV